MEFGWPVSLHQNKAHKTSKLRRFVKHKGGLGGAEVTLWKARFPSAVLSQGGKHTHPHTCPVNNPNPPVASTPPW